ncbi:uncharacterized protein CELE_T07E3.2 [Caenorhabditis elegans]|uniref:Uncharacterized protein n=1 Tax=Caenorhabditis elegans TaxID=6239 RepID=Q22313_CAEEL|nr:Uncharacterized protein CELE_T07E3.2 [Caenorhabditis elegans]CCD72021.1 Uncharacterized protein CELE_T07E3.2 [Caenorhabditis elegans]|eukprot:NP_498504.1 Uncharacterized protein CELE_T07E3.2 [Caenorhabditis elegans]
MNGDLFVIIFNFCIITFSVYLGIGCKKKKNKDLISTRKNKTPIGSPASTSEHEKIVIPTPPPAPPMVAREANDNETINDAKSDWGDLPA